MVSWIKEKPFKNLLFICVFITLLNCVILFSQTSQSATKSQSSKQCQYSNSTLQDVSVSSSAITPEEVKLREQQVQIAKRIESFLIKFSNLQGSNITLDEVLQTTYQRINSEIQLLQAQELLRLKKNSVS